jgi:hypothetical protein
VRCHKCNDFAANFESRFRLHLGRVGSLVLFPKWMVAGAFGSRWKFSLFPEMDGGWWAQEESSKEAAGSISSLSHWAWSESRCKVEKAFSLAPPDSMG